MDEGEERLIRVTIGTLTRAIRVLATSVGGINTVVRESIGAGLSRPSLLDDIEKELVALDEALLRIAETFPPEDPGSGNGKPL